MAKITKHHLDFESENDYELIGICSHVGDYRLVWNLNESLNLNLEKAQEFFVVNHRKGNFTSQHPYFLMHNEDERWDIYLIANKFEGKFLIPEKQQIDYFLFVCNNFTIDLDEWIEKMRTINCILAVFDFDPKTITSTEQIVFE